MHRAFAFLLLLFACLSLSAQVPDFIPYQDAAGWGYVDTNGQVVIPGKWGQVFFFNGDRAYVRNWGEHHNGMNCAVCIINRKGNYIVPPERNWTGMVGSNAWNGQLNTVDSNGKWGLIDTDDHLILPYLYDVPVSAYDIVANGISDSFKIVSKGGFAGLINEKNEVVLPFKYSEIKPLNHIGGTLRALMVADADNKGGQNRFGVVMLDGTEILPMQFTDISYIEKDGICGFVVYATSERNEGYVNTGNREERWIEYPSMRQKKMPHMKEDRIVYRKRVGNYISVSWWEDPGNGAGITDTNGKELIPCCDVIKVNRDSIVERKQTISSDSLIVAYSVLSAKNLQQVAGPLFEYRYRDPNQTFGMPEGLCSRGGRAWSQAQAQVAAKPRISKCNGAWRFFKDSMLCQTEQYVGDHPLPAQFQVYPHRPVPGADIPYYSCTGAARMGRYPGRSYGFVLDDDLNYIVQPVGNVQFIAIDSRDSIAATAHALYNFQGKELMVTKAEITGGTRWNGSLYAYKAKRGVLSQQAMNRMTEGYYDEPGIIGVTVVDTAGVANGQWAHSYIADKVPDSYLPHGGCIFAATDTAYTYSVYSQPPAGAGRRIKSLKFLNPAGESALPALCNKYKQVSFPGNNWYLVTDVNDNRLLVDSTGKEVVRDFNVSAIKPALMGTVMNPNYGTAIPGLYLITGNLRNEAKTISFYINKRGKCYTNQVVDDVGDN